MGDDDHAQHHVLVVEDFESTREAIVAILETKGFDVRSAETGLEALELLEAGFRPCVMLLDVRMPGLDGWGVWDRMRQHRELALIPVVMFSADPEDDARARAVGIRQFVQKPVDGRRLLEVLDRHCDQRRAAVQ